MNYTEMEAKVREATNNEPWGMLQRIYWTHVVTDVLPRCLFVADAGNRQWHIQLVGGSLCPRGRFDSRQQPIAQRNHAYDVQTLHRESCRGMEADLQSKAILLTCYNAYS
jgi:hypothetical protein